MKYKNKRLHKRKKPEDLIANYFLEGEQEVYLAKREAANKPSSIVLGIKPNVGLEVYPLGVVKRSDLKIANDIALGVLSRTVGYVSIVTKLTQSRPKSERTLHRQLSTVFRYWEPDKYVHNANNSVFFEGYRRSIRREQK